jgi:hypothetical protein
VQKPEDTVGRWCRAWFFAGLAVLLVISRLCHLRILWAEEGYGAAGGVETVLGKVIYRDFWFDKPPLAALIYVLWGAFPGWPLRLAGAAFAFLTVIAAWKCASVVWRDREGNHQAGTQRCHEAEWAAGLAAFFQIFDIPPAAMTIGPDLLTVPLVFWGVACARSGLVVWAGLACALAVHSNAKALLLVPVVLMWTERRRLATFTWAIGFFLLGLTGLAIVGALPSYWRQVWEFGRLYAKDTFVVNPWREGALRTMNWLGFHAALLIPAVCAWRKVGPRVRLNFAVWIAAGTIGVVAGLRFFPRYYLILLPPLVLLASRGFALLWTSGRPVEGALGVLWKARCVRVLRFLAVALLLIPLGRFGPRYAILAGDLLAGRSHQWADLALNQDSETVAAMLKSLFLEKGTDRGSGEDLRAPTLFVWGYRPDLFAYTRFLSGTPFLDSQMLTGVLGDRHLTSAHITIPDAAQNRKDLIKTQPTLLVDGLGLLNPALAIDQYPELRDWLAQSYRKVGQTKYSLVYQRK